jgi:hypothetical protein
LTCLLLAPPPGGADEQRAEEKRAVPLYTNEDLERVAPYRGQTGVTTKRAPETAPKEKPAARGSEGRRAEAFWRREAQRVRERTRPVLESIAELRRRIDERWRKPGVLASQDPQIQAWQQKLRTLEQRVRAWEDELEERARREGAMPGWLR